MVLTIDPEIEALLGSEATADRLTPETGVGHPAAMTGPYDGASRFSRELASWNPTFRSVDNDILPVKKISDARTRDTLRNDAYVAAGADIHKDSIVGGAYLLNAKPAHKILGLDETWAAEFQEEVETKFTLAAESPNNWLDASGLNTLTSMTRLALGVYLASGEVLASAEWLRRVNRPFNTAIQMIDVDRLSNPRGVMDSPTLRGGVRRDKYGAPVGYYIQQAHPTDWTNQQEAWNWKYVEARKPWGRQMIIHLFRQERPDQTRGISAMVSALKELKITKKFRDIVLQNAVVNATYAASIESELPSDVAFQALGGGNADAITEYASRYLGAVAEYSGGAKNMHIDGVRIPHLFPGTKLQLRPASQAGPLGTEFEQSLLRYIAANLGVSYEELSRDYSETNYSSARAALNQTWKHMQAEKSMIADRFASSIYWLWLEEQMNKGEITSLPRNALQTLYDGVNREAYAQCEWIGASRGQIDELKETQAAVLRLKYHLSTYEEEHARLGKDFRKVFVQREREQKEMKERGLEVDPQDNMMNATTGAPRQKEAKDEKSDGSEDNTDA